MNIAKTAYKNTALARCLVSHVQDFQESFEQFSKMDDCRELCYPIYRG
jgi:hypothetical protein